MCRFLNGIHLLCFISNTVLETLVSLQNTAETGWGMLGQVAAQDPLTLQPWFRAPKLDGIVQHRRLVINFRARHNQHFTVSVYRYVYISIIVDKIEIARA